MNIYAFSSFDHSVSMRGVGEFLSCYIIIKYHIINSLNQTKASENGASVLIRYKIMIDECESWEVAYAREKKLFFVVVFSSSFLLLFFCFSVSLFTTK